jgi:hypothetical protein
VQALKLLIVAVLAGAIWPGAFAQDAPSRNPASATSADAQARDAKGGLPPRATPADYQAHAQAGNITIAAEFTGHSIATGQAIYSSEDYVAVEVALFGPPDARLNLAIGDFSLRVNGRKMPSPAQPFGLLFASLKDPEWEPPASASSKGKTSIGSNGDQNNNDPPPAPVHMPIELKRAMQQRVQKASLPEGERVLPDAGLLYFPYKGKPEGIHTIELIYGGAAGKATLELHP